ncbi:hypothetical protein FGO68_gene15919 [Halteria grandinella]|uniref:Uncharacterized protein n=1 Tax=Halteria grandinella TaxID=5974 RepID=A0A8J8P6Z8_HALGN|nr:hypothetical protein FGO68_gene15919 [Halteria grandinella]
MAFKNYTQPKVLEETNKSLGTTMVAFNALSDTLEHYKGVKSEIKMTIDEFKGILKEKENLQSELKERFEKELEKNLRQNAVLERMIGDQRGIIESQKNKLGELQELVMTIQKDCQQANDKFRQVLFNRNLTQDTYTQHITFLKHQITDLTSILHQQATDFTKQYQTQQLKVDFQSNLIVQLQKDSKQASEQSVKHQMQASQANDLIKQAQSEKSQVELKLTKVGERIRNIWETQCEAYLHTLKSNGSDIQGILGTVEMISSEINLQKKQSLQYKEENFKLLQQISNFADIANNYKQQPTPVQNYRQQSGASQDSFLTTEFSQAMNESMLQHPHSKKSSYNTVQHCSGVTFRNGLPAVLTPLPSKSQERYSNQGLLSFNQQKRNELCEILREEVKQLQSESQSKNEIIITAKRQLQIAQECILEKQQEFQKKLAEYETLEEVQSELIKEREDIQRVNKELRLALSEQCHQVSFNLKKHEADTEALVLRKDQLLLENKSLKEENEDLRRIKSDLECKLEQSGERVEDCRRREKELIESCSRLRSRLTEKDRQQEMLRKEVDRAIQKQSELEIKVDNQAPVSKPAQTQTVEPDEEHLLSLENDRLQRELSQVKGDIEQLLDSYEARRQENLELREDIDRLRETQRRVEKENVELRQNLEHERANNQELKAKEEKRQIQKKQRKMKRAASHEKFQSGRQELQGELLADKQYAEFINSKTEESELPQFEAKLKQNRLQGPNQSSASTLQQNQNPFKRSKSRNQNSKSTLRKYQTEAQFSRAQSAVQYQNHQNFPQVLERVQTQQQESKENIMLNSQEFMPQILMTGASSKKTGHIHETRAKYKRKLMKRVHLLDILLGSIIGNEDISPEKTDNAIIFISRKCPQLLEKIEHFKNMVLSLQMQKFDLYLGLAKTIAMRFCQNQQFSRLIYDIEYFSSQYDFNQAAFQSEQLTDMIGQFVMNLQSLSVKQNDSLIHISLSSEDQPIQKLTPTFERLLSKKLFAINLRLKAKVQLLEQLQELLSQLTQSSRDSLGEQLATMMIEFNSLMKIDLIYDQKQVNDLLRYLPPQEKSNQSHATTMSGETDPYASLNKDSSIQSFKDDFSRYSQVLKRLEGIHQSLRDSSMVITLTAEHTTLNDKQSALLKASQLKTSINGNLIRLIEKQDENLFHNDQPESSNQTGRGQMEKILMQIPSFADRMLLRLRMRIAQQKAGSLERSKDVRQALEEVRAYLDDNTDKIIPGLRVFQEYLEMRKELNL